MVGGTLVRAARNSRIELERVPRDFVGAGGVTHCERLIPGLLKDVES